MSRTAPAPGIAASAAYAAGSFGTGVFTTVPAILLLYFCTETLHMAAGWAAIVVFIPKVWAILWDPLVGAWSDGTATRIGRRRPFLIAGAVGVALAFVAVFSPPVLSPAATIAWMIVAYFVLASVYSIFAVPYVAIPSEIPANSSVRARLVAWRMWVAMIGILAGAGLVPYLIAHHGGGRVGYHAMSLIIASACGLSMLIPLLMLRGRDSPLIAHTGAHVRALWLRLRAVSRERAFLRLSSAYILQLTAVGVISASAPYLVTGAFGRPESDIGTAMIAMLGATTIAMPAWASLGQRYGVARLLIAAIVLFGVSALALGILALNEGSWLSGRVAFALAGVPFAGMQVLPYTLVAQMIHMSAKKSAAGESSYAGAWTAAEKLGLAIGPALTGVVLALSPRPGTIGVALLVCAAPMVLGLLSVPLLLRAVPLSEQPLTAPP